MGKRANYIRPIMFKLTTCRKKNKIMENKVKLRDIPHKIFFNEDWPKEIAEQRRVTRIVLRELKEKGVNAYVKKGKIMVDNEILSDKLMNEIKGKTDKKKRSRSIEEENIINEPSTPVNTCGKIPGIKKKKSNIQNFFLKTYLNNENTQQN